MLRCLVCLLLLCRAIVWFINRSNIICAQYVCINITQNLSGRCRRHIFSVRTASTRFPATFPAIFGFVGAIFFWIVVVGGFIVIVVILWSLSAGLCCWFFAAVPRFVSFVARFCWGFWSSAPPGFVIWPSASSLIIANLFFLKKLLPKSKNRSIKVKILK